MLFIPGFISNDEEASDDFLLKFDDSQDLRFIFILSPESNLV